MAPLEGGEESLDTTQTASDYSLPGLEPAEDLQENPGQAPSQKRGAHVHTHVRQKSSSRTRERVLEQREGGAGEREATLGGRAGVDDPVKYHLPLAQVNQRQIFKENPRVYYMNGESLSRPFTLPRKERIGQIILVVIAAFIAGALLFSYFDSTTNEPERIQSEMKENLARNVSLDAPNLLSLLDLDDATIDATIKASGATFYDTSPVGSATTYATIKLPSDVSLEEAGTLYMTGISKLNAAQASLLLNGAWKLEVDRTDGMNISLHFADFKSGSVENAITAAVETQDLERGGEGDSGEDDGYGNAYSTGSIMVNGSSYIWTVSAVALKQVYSVAGLPDTSVYVGVRIRNS